MLLELALIDLVKQIDKSQWNHNTDLNILDKYPVISRNDLRYIEMKKQLYTAKTSGSTGEQVTVEKTIQDFLWGKAATIRSILWRNWDMKNDVAKIYPTEIRNTKEDWGFPKEIAPIQGKVYSIGFEPISEIQKYLEEKNPHYIGCRPSIFAQIDTSKITNFISWGGSGEMGGDVYSSEECGVIAITCPDNKNVMHVMENIIVEVDKENNLIITSLTNPYIKRYKIGDKGSFSKCNCGRSLQTISNIIGRERNLLVLPNGDKKWALFGSQSMWDKFKIKRYQVIQTSINDIEIKIISEEKVDELDLKEHMSQWLKDSFNIKITYVDNFPDGKFEEFKSLIA